MRSDHRTTQLLSQLLLSSSIFYLIYRKTPALFLFSSSSLTSQRSHILMSSSPEVHRLVFTEQSLYCNCSHRVCACPSISYSHRCLVVQLYSVQYLPEEVCTVIHCIVFTGRSLRCYTKPAAFPATRELISAGKTSHDGPSPPCKYIPICTSIHN